MTINWHKAAIATLGIVFGLIVLLPVAVSAQQNGRSQGASNQQQKNQESGEEPIEDRIKERRAAAKERVNTIKQEVKARKEQLKQDVCERRQTKLQRAIPQLSNGAKSVKSSIDKMYERVQGFYESGQLTVSNYDELNANVAEAQADSEVYIEAIETYEFDLDCEDETTGEQLDSYRTAISMTRESLKVYRTQLVALISSMRAAAAEDATTAEDVTIKEENEEAETSTEEGVSDEE